MWKCGIGHLLRVLPPPVLLSGSCYLCLLQPQVKVLKAPSETSPSSYPSSMLALNLALNLALASPLTSTVCMSPIPPPPHPTHIHTSSLGAEGPDGKIKGNN